MTEAMPLEARFEHVRLGESSSSASEARGSAFGGLSFDMTSGSDVQRAAFAEVFDREVEYLTSLNIIITKERKRQILADILVWAEVTQQHYDEATRSFVVKPNQHDESFQRVGRFLDEARQRLGI